MDFNQLRIGKRKKKKENYLKEFSSNYVHKKTCYVERMNKKIICLAHKWHKSHCGRKENVYANSQIRSVYPIGVRRYNKDFWFQYIFTAITP